MDPYACTPDAVNVSVISSSAHAAPAASPYPPYSNTMITMDTVVEQPHAIAEFRKGFKYRRCPKPFHSCIVLMPNGEKNCASLTSLQSPSNRFEMDYPHTYDWMAVPIGVPDCPRGLEYLSTLDKLLVKQKHSLTEAFLGFEANNKYILKNCLGQNVYMAIEDTDCCTRNCCGNCRPFDMKVLDLFSNEIIHFYRPLACSGCCFPCCMQTIEVSSPPGDVIGRVDEEWTCWFPNYKIKNHLNETVLRIEGPCVTWSCCSDINFKIVDMNGTEIGQISKKWSGLAREFFTDADYFGINFPMDLDAKLKATLIGACMLIDMMYFEDNEGKE